MTLPFGISNLYAVMADIAPQAIDQALTERSYFWRMLPKVASDRPMWQVKTAGNDSATSGFTVGGSLPDAGAVSFSDAKMNWGNYFGAIKFSDRELKEAATAASRMKIGDLLSTHVNDLATQLVEKVATDLISGATDSSTAGTIIGLTGGAIEDDNTYAAINRSSVTAHAPYVNDNGGGGNRAVSTTLIDDVLDTVRYTREGSLTVGFCDIDQWNSIAALSGVTETKNDRTGLGVSKFLGVTEIAYKGIPIVAVPGYTANRLDFVDERFLEIRYLPQTGSPNTASTIEQAFDLKMPEVTGDSFVWKCFAYLQLVLREGRLRAASLQELS